VLDLLCSENHVCASLKSALLPSVAGMDGKADMNRLLFQPTQSSEEDPRATAIHLAQELLHDLSLFNMWVLEARNAAQN